ncbi:MAG: DNA polymerase Y family protein [Pseudonocardia sp.]
MPGAVSGAAVSDAAVSAVPVRVLALWSPDWPVTAAAVAAHVPLHRPAAVFVANRVLACSALARSRGVRRGLRRREAQARCPELVVLARDPDRDARVFEPVVAAVEELAPGVEVVRPGLVALAARGPVGWFGGEQAAAEKLVDQVAVRTGVECQVGLADGLFAAVLAARRGVTVEPGATPAFLAPLGVAELDREPDVDRSELVGLLRRLGLRSLGAFGALDPADVASRFGADAVLGHRLARGLDPRPPVRRHPPEELAVEIELDPPVDRVDTAAFAARGLAERLHRTLAGHGLSCTRLGVGARTVTGEQLYRVWRCAEPLAPAGTVDRVRWQLDAWLTRGGSGAVSRLWLVPEETVTAGALQLGLWGEAGEADERARRVLVRVQALLGPESVVTAVLVGGRDPAEQVRLVPWGEERVDGPPAAEGREGDAVPDASAGPADDGAAATPSAVPAGWPQDVVRRTGTVSAAEAGNPSVIGGVDPGTAPGTVRGPDPAITGDGWPVRGQGRPTNRRRRVPFPRRSTGRLGGREPPPPWPGRLPAPSPATVPPQHLPVQLLDSAGNPVRLTAPDLLSAPPHHVVDAGGRSRAVHGWAGPWPLWQRWWVSDGVEGSRLQVALDDGVALLLLAREGRWWITGVYD